MSLVAQSGQKRLSKPWSPPGGGGEGRGGEGEREEEREG